MYMYIEFEKEFVIYVYTYEQEYDTSLLYLRKNSRIRILEFVPREKRASFLPHKNKKMALWLATNGSIPKFWYSLVLNPSLLKLPITYI